MEFEEIVRSAQEETRLPDPEVDSWQEGLEILLHDHAREGNLTERGAGIMRARYVKALAARMRVDDYHRRYPDLAASKIERPVFIVGMPRTGTTLASYLFDADPAVRSLLKWEAYDGVPPADPGGLGSDPRCLEEKKRDEMVLAANPEGAATHWEDADGPTECVHLMAQDFRTLMYPAMTSAPTYNDWLLDCDTSTTQLHRRRVYQILQSTNPGRWVLKLPSDSLWLRPLMAEFPSARIIWTHRDPFVAFASSMSMRGRSRLLFNRDMDLPYMRSRYPRQLSLHLTRALETSRERPADFYHLYYDDFVSDPIAQMKQIYDWLGDEWTPAAEAGMRAWLADNPQGRRGAHRYTLEEWGFTRKDLEPLFSDYLHEHAVAQR